MKDTHAVATKKAPLLQCVDFAQKKIDQFNGSFFSISRSMLPDMEKLMNQKGSN
jgi:hypothetical protein